MKEKNLDKIKKSISSRYNNIPAKYKIFFDKKSNVKFASIDYINYLIFNSFYIYK